MRKRDGFLVRTGTLKMSEASEEDYHAMYAARSVVYYHWLNFRRNPNYLSVHPDDLASLKRVYNDPSNYYAAGPSVRNFNAVFGVQVVVDDTVEPGKPQASPPRPLD